MSQIGMMYFLMAVSMGGSAPAMTALASFDTSAACMAAADSLSKAVATGTAAAQFACFPATSLDTLGESRLQ